VYEKDEITALFYVEISMPGCLRKDTIGPCRLFGCKYLIQLRIARGFARLGTSRYSEQLWNLNVSQSHHSA